MPSTTYCGLTLSFLKNEPSKQSNALGEDILLLKPFWSFLITGASLVTQRVEKFPARQETQVWFLGWEDALEKEMAAHSSVLAWENPMDRGAWRATLCGVAKSQTRLNNYAAATAA